MYIKGLSTTNPGPAQLLPIARAIKLSFILLAPIGQYKLSPKQVKLKGEIKQPVEIK